MNEQRCKCCGELIQVIGPMLNENGIADAGHCVNPVCPLELVTLSLTSLPLITEAEMMQYAKAKILRLHQDLQHTRSRLPPARLLG